MALSSTFDPIVDMLPTLLAPMAMLPLFAAAYRLLAPLCSTDKQRAYILSTLSSGVMSLASLRYLTLWWTSGWQGLLWEALSVSNWARLGVSMSQAGTVFFASYLLADLVVGVIAYPEHIALLTGWIHHSVYIALMMWLQFTPWTGIFMLAAAMEIPTFHLAISTLSPRLFRHDATFLVLFFALRIAFHGYLSATFLLPPGWLRAIGASSGLEAIGGSRAAGWLLFSAMPLHVSWFSGGIKGYLRRRAQRAIAADKVAGVHRAVAVPMCPSATKAASHDAGADEEEVLLDSKTISDHQSDTSRIALTSWNIPEDVPALEPPSSGLMPPSPQDTPIATPMLTPGTSLAQLGGGYFFSKLPTSLPGMASFADLHMPSLPELHLPPLALPSLTSYPFARSGGRAFEGETGAASDPANTLDRLGEVSEGEGDFASAILSRETMRNRRIRAHEESGL